MHDAATGLAANERRAPDHADATHGFCSRKSPWASPTSGSVPCPSLIKHFHSAGYAHMAQSTCFKTFLNVTHGGVVGVALKRHALLYTVFQIDHDGDPTIFQV